MALLCDRFHLSDRFSASAYFGIEEGMSVWVRESNLPHFFTQIYPLIEVPFVLVTGDSVVSVPYEIENAPWYAPVLRGFNGLGSRKIIRWFAQNCLPQDEETSRFFTPIPVGIDFHSQYEGSSWRFAESLTPSTQEELLLSIRESAPPAKDRRRSVYVDFHFNNSSRRLTRRVPLINETRRSVYKLFKKKKESCFVFQEKRLPRIALWKRYAENQFVVSPHGTGLDCHRTWEALALGCFVIVRRSSLDPLYQGLPVVIVDDYNEVNSDNIAKWSEELQEKYGDADLPPELTNRFWFDKIRAAGREKSV